MSWTEDPNEQTSALPVEHVTSGQPARQESTLVTVGDIACSQHWVTTPAGSHPLGGSTWIVTNQTTVSERIPPYAIILAIVFALACLLGLLFLLIKERTVQGFMQVSVQGPGFYYATRVRSGWPARPPVVKRGGNSSA